MDKYFLTQVKRANGVWEKGVVVKNSLDEARQSFHAYLGAYGYKNDPAVDFVMCYIVDSTGAVTDHIIDDRRPAEV